MSATRAQQVGPPDHRRATVQTCWSQRQQRFAQAPAFRAPSGGRTGGSRCGVRVEVFGSTLVVDAAGRSVRPGAPPATRVLTHLVAARGRPVATDALIEHGWGRTVSAPTLRMTVSRLRKALDPATNGNSIVHAHDGYLLGPDVAVDVRRFEEALSEASRRPFSADVFDTLAKSLDLWRGDPYADGDSAVVGGERHRLVALRIEAVQRLQRCAVAIGRPRAAHHYLRTVAGEHPGDEGLAEVAMRALYGIGDAAGALAVYEITRRWLDDELGLAPSPDLRELADAVLRHTIPAAEGLEAPTTSASRIDGYGVGWIVRPALDRMSRSGAQGGTVDTTAHGIATRAAISAAAGDWDDALKGYTAAVGAALGNGQFIDAAEFCLRLARITWDPDIADATEVLIHRVLEDLTDETAIARLRLCLAGGLFRRRTVDDVLDQVGDMRGDVSTIESSGSASALGWALTHFRDGLVGALPNDEATRITEQIYSLVGEDTLLFGQNVRAHFSFALRMGDRAGAHRVLRTMQQTIGTDPSAVDAFGLITASNCWDLAMGRYGAVRRGLDDALDYDGRLRSATYDQVVLGQSFWLTRELGERSSMRAHMGGARALAEIDATTPLWPVAAALMASDLGDHQLALGDLDATMSTFDLRALPPGPHRTGILAFVAEILAAARLAGEPVSMDLASVVAGALEEDPSDGVLLGWPTVFIGPKSRYMAFAAASLDRRVEAEAHARAAVAADRWMPAMCRRSLWAAAAVTRGPDADGFRVRADRITAALADHR